MPCAFFYWSLFTFIIEEAMHEELRKTQMKQVMHTGEKSE